MKTYKEILDNKENKKELIRIDIDQTALTKVKNIDEALALADQFIPHLQKKILTSEMGLSSDKRDQWLSVVDESMHAMEIVPQRRTITEKTQAVLQQNRFPTASAKFHQAVLESSAYTGMIIDETFSYETSKLKLEKKFYKYQKQLEKLQNRQSAGEDTFLEEKDLEIKKILLTKEIMSLKASERAIQNKREELIEWSNIKKELYDEAMANNEIWSPDSIDGDAGLQEVSLAQRHLGNYVILKQNPSEGDISSVLNIEGLALTAVREGMKKNKLGLYINLMTDEQIEVIFLGIYGWNVAVERKEGFIGIKNLSTEQILVYPTTLAIWQQMAGL